MQDGLRSRGTLCRGPRGRPRPWRPGGRHCTTAPPSQTASRGAPAITTTRTRSCFRRSGDAANSRIVEPPLPWRSAAGASGRSSSPSGPASPWWTGGTSRLAAHHVGVRRFDGRRGDARLRAPNDRSRPGGRGAAEIDALRGALPPSPRSAALAGRLDRVAHLDVHRSGGVPSISPVQRLRARDSKVATISRSLAPAGTTWRP
jgi:hypothetical protein